jgi:hypothetical protein
MGRFAYAGAVGLFSRGQPLHTGMCATPAELERPFANCFCILSSYLIDATIDVNGGRSIRAPELKRDGESDTKTVRLAP